MPPLHLLTVTNDYFTGRLPIGFEEPFDAIPFTPPTHREYRARYIPTGPDTAIALTPSDIECYVAGKLCDEENAFTEFVSAYRSLLHETWRDLKQQDDDTVILTGRWHRPEADRGPFDEPPHPGTGRFNAYVIHVINTEGSVTSKKYDRCIFEQGSFWSETSVTLYDDINTDFVATLQERTEAMLETSSDYCVRTAFGIMLVDGVAWFPSEPSAPVIFSTRPRSDEHQRFQDLSLQIRADPIFKQYEVIVEGKLKGVYEAVDKRSALNVYATHWTYGNCGTIEHLRLMEAEFEPVEAYYGQFHVVEVDVAMRDAQVRALAD